MSCKSCFFVCVDKHDRNAYNLAVVFSPILLRPPGNDEMVMMANLEPATEVVRFLVKVLRKYKHVILGHH